MAKQGTILVVDDTGTPDRRTNAVRDLLREGYHHLYPNKIKNTLHDENVDVVLLDMNFSAGINSGNEGLFGLSDNDKVIPRYKSFSLPPTPTSIWRYEESRGYRFRGKTMGQR